MNTIPGEQVDHGRIQPPDELDRLWQRLQHVPLRDLTPLQREMCERHIARRRIVVSHDPRLRAYSAEVCRTDGRRVRYAVAARSERHACNVVLARERSRGHRRSALAELVDLGSLMATNPAT